VSAMVSAGAIRAVFSSRGPGAVVRVVCQQPPRQHPHPESRRTARGFSGAQAAM
jgi:hypothetical protein